MLTRYIYFFFNFMSILKISFFLIILSRIFRLINKITIFMCYFSINFTKFVFFLLYEYPGPKSLALWYTAATCLWLGKFTLIPTRGNHQNLRYWAPGGHFLSIRVVSGPREPRATRIVRARERAGFRVSGRPLRWGGRRLGDGIDPDAPEGVIRG